MRKKLLLGLPLLLLLGGAGVVLGGPPQVPDAVIASSVTRTPALLERAWQLPAAAAYRRNLSFQSNGSVCGPASVANAFHSLGEPADSEARVLEGTGLCWTGICFGGLTLDQVAEVARAHTTRSVRVLRDLGLEAFRREMQRSNDPSRRYLVNFTRKAIFGAGGGHHSPIGGYLEQEDLVFVLDVNAKFQPWLVETARLHAAVDTLDGERKRGLLLLQ